jgi:DNA polymerase-3 subunit epsilon
LSVVCFYLPERQVNMNRQEKVCAWASSYVSSPANWAILDTETTGISEDDEVIELALVSPTGSILFSSLIQPQNMERCDLATHIHGISREMLVMAPTLPQMWPVLQLVLSLYPRILVYNATFDSRLLRQTGARYGLVLPAVSWDCVMLRYAEYHGAWNSYHHSYIWQKLQVAADRLGVVVDGSYHRATADALVTLGVLRALACAGSFSQGGKTHE